MSGKHGINNEYTNSFKKRISLNTVITTSNPKYSTITAENTYKRIPAPSHNTEENSNILNKTTKITYHQEVITKPKPKVFIYDSNSSNYRTVLSDEKQRNARGFPRSNTEANKIIPIRTFDIKNIPTNERLTAYKREEKTTYQNQAKALIDRMNRSRKNGISNNYIQNKSTYIKGYDNEKGSDLISQSHDFDLDNKIENRTFIQNTHKNNDINKNEINEKKDQFQRRYRGEIVTPNATTSQFTNKRKNIIHGFSNIRNNETNPVIKNENSNNTKPSKVSIKDYHYHQITQKRTNDANDTKETNPNNSYFYQNKISYIMHNNTNTNLNSNNNRLNQNKMSSSNLNNQDDGNNKRFNKSRLSYTLENNPYYSQVIPKRDNNEERPTYDRGIAKNRQQQNIKLDKYMDRKMNKEEEKASGQKTVIETSDGPVIEKIRNKDGSVTTVIRQTKITPQNPQFGQVKTTRGTSDMPSVRPLITQENKTVSSYNKDNKTLTSDARQNRVVDRRNKFNEDDKNNKSIQGRNVEKPKEKKNENLTEKKEYFFSNKRQQYKNQKLENNNDNKGSNYNTTKKDETSLKGTTIITDRRGNRSNIQNTNTNTKPVNNNENTSRKGGTIRIGKRGDRSSYSNPVNDDKNIIKTEKNEDKTNTQKKALPPLNNVITNTRVNNNRSDNDNSRPLNTDGNIPTKKYFYQSRRDKDNNIVNDLTIKTGKNENNIVEKKDMNIRIGGKNNALDDKLKANDLLAQKKSDRAKSGNRKQLRSSLKHGKRRKSAAPKKVKFGKNVRNVGIKQNTDTGVSFNVNDNTKEETNNTLKENNEEEQLIEEINRKGESASREEKQKRLDYLINLYGQCCLGFYKSTEESILEKIADVLLNVGENDKKEILYKFNNTFPKSKELYQKLNGILSKKNSTAGKVMIYDTNDNVRRTNFNSGNVTVSRSTDPQISNDGSSPFDKYFKDRQAKIKKGSS